MLSLKVRNKIMSNNKPTYEELENRISLLENKLKFHEAYIDSPKRLTSKHDNGHSDRGANIKKEETSKENDASKDKLFSIIAHDLRSPFTSILEYTKLLRDNIDDFDTEQIKEFLGFVCSSTKNTLNLLENLLSWTKSQSGKIEFAPQQIELGPIVNETIEILDNAAKIKSIRLDYETETNLAVFADLNMLQTVLRNLISNAIKFTDIGGEIIVSAKKQKHEIEIAVSDNGIGISEDRIENLFKIENSSTTYGTANEKGSGLGLVICKEFVEKHQGHLWVESNLGIGTDFRFTIPTPTEK